jgi:hypothetical protein
VLPYFGVYMFGENKLRIEFKDLEKRSRELSSDELKTIFGGSSFVNKLKSDLDKQKLNKKF